MLLGEYSLNQVDQTCRKAARGVGLPWGMADETGKAVRWLNTFGLGGLVELADLLASSDRQSLTASTPQTLELPWQSKQGSLNPLAMGPTLADSMTQPETERIETGQIRYPLLMAGFLGQALLKRSQSVSLQWRQVTLIFFKDALIIDGNRQHLQTPSCPLLVCERTVLPSSGKEVLPTVGSIRVDLAVWHQLEQLAHRTYVEVTDWSRQTGAGAGLSDND